jgi:iron complex transport system substrate-binding protein
MRSALPALALLLTTGPATALPGPPHRIVSINPCVDALLMQVADADQIAGISLYSKDPRASSISQDQARRFPGVSASAEAILARRPDLVITGAYVAPSTLAALRRIRIRLLQMPVPDTMAVSKGQIRTLALAAGHADRGERLAEAIDAAAARAQPPDKTLFPALIWQKGGLVPGAGTLADELLRTAGYRNLSRDYGLKAWDVLPLERLAARPPQLLLSGTDPELQDRLLGHPAMAQLKRRIRVADYPERLLHCGGPTIIEALARLSEVRSQSWRR